MANKEKQWERVQERAFTQWMSQTLQTQGMTVQDIRIDIQDGIKLIAFFEILSGKKVRQNYAKTPKNKIAKIANLSVALNFLTEIGVHNPGCSAEDIIDAETRGIKLILGLLWILFRRYKMSEAAESAGGGKQREEDAILEWVRKKVDGYEGIEVKNFKTSFGDGKIFLALVHSYCREDPEFDYDESIKTMSQEEILGTAFDLAEKRLGITKLLAVEEFMDGNVDERSISLYTTLFVSAFKAKDKMLELQKNLGNQQQSLLMEHKSREELTKINQELNVQSVQLKKALEDEQEHAKSLDALCDELKRENVDQSELLEQLRQEYKKLQETYDHLSSQNDAELEEKLKAEKKEHETKKEELKTEAAHVVDLNTEYERLKAELEAKKTSGEETTTSLRKRARKTNTNLNGMKTVHSNLDQHSDDLVHWQRYLDGTASSASADDYMLSLAAELKKLQGNENIEEKTVEILRERFAEEQKAMVKLLAQRKDLEKTDAAAAAKRKK